MVSTSAPTFETVSLKVPLLAKGPFFALQIVLKMCDFESFSYLSTSVYCVKLEWGLLQWKVELVAEFYVLASGKTS